MTAPLSADLRRRLVRAVEAGSSAREAARRFEVSPSAAIKLMQRVRAKGSAAPAKVGGYRKPLRGSLATISVDAAHRPRSGPKIDGPVDRGRGRRRCLPPSYAVAARRLPLRPPVYSSASHPLEPAPLPPAPRHQPAARHRGRQAEPLEVQALPHRLLPHRHRRGPDRAGQAPPLRCHRQNIEVRLRRTAREGHAPCRGQLPPNARRSRSLQDPHRAHRQRHALYRAYRRWLDTPGHQTDVGQQAAIPLPCLRVRLRRTRYRA